MRKFGTEATKVFEFQLEGSEKVYEIPLAASLPSGELLNLQTADEKDEGFFAQREMLRKYMGDIVEELTVTTLSDILKAWAEESTAQGEDPGESSALSD